MTEIMTAKQFREQGGGARRKSTRAVLAGGKAQSHGKLFERLLEQTHAHYAATGILNMTKLPVETSPLPPGFLKDPSRHAGRARQLSGQAPFDYFGSFGEIPDGQGPWWLRGRLVVLEAKSTSTVKTSLPIAEKAGLREHQLEACNTVGGQFYAVPIVVWLNGDKRGVLLPDAVKMAWRRYLKRERVSVPWSAFTPYERSISPRGPIENWLPAVLEYFRTQETKS